MIPLASDRWFLEMQGEYRAPVH